MFLARVLIFTLFFPLSPAAFGQQLPAREALDLIESGRWRFNCPGQVRGQGHVRFIDKQNSIQAEITVKGDGWLASATVLEQPVKVSVKLAPASFPTEIKQKSICGSILGFEGCFLVDKKDDGFNLFYFAGDGWFGGFSGPRNSEFCAFRKVSEIILLSQQG